MNFKYAYFREGHQQWCHFPEDDIIKAFVTTKMESDIEDTKKTQ